MLVNSGVSADVMLNENESRNCVVHVPKRIRPTVGSGVLFASDIDIGVRDL